MPWAFPRELVMLNCAVGLGAGAAFEIECPCSCYRAILSSLARIRACFWLCQGTNLNIAGIQALRGLAKRFLHRDGISTATTARNRTGRSRLAAIFMFVGLDSARIDP